MDIHIQPHGDIAVVVITGSVDGLNAVTVLDTLQDHVAQGNTRLVVDLQGVAYTSSAGLRALLATVKEARRRGGDLRLARINPNVRKVLELSGFVTILKVYGEIEEAVGSYAP